LKRDPGARAVSADFGAVAVQNPRVLNGARLALFVGLTVALAAVTVLFVRSWILAAFYSNETVITFAATAFVGIVIANPIARWLLLPRMRRPVSRPARAGWRVAAVTTHVPGSESLAMLAATLRAMKAMHYPHDCWLLDEGDTDEAKELCHRLDILHFSRKNRSEYQAEAGLFQSRSKHGNYNAWLTEVGFSAYDIVAGFDPDHVPSPEFLSLTLGYFDDERVGYVQSAQAYYNQDASFIAAGAAEETYDYYSTIQMAAYGMGFPVVIGSHNIHRVSALQQVGGFAPHDADDLLITMFYRARKWGGVYVPAILARGLTPVDWNGYLTQQRRWARSVLDIKLRLQPSLAAGLPQQSKLASYLHGLSYLQPAVLLGLGLFVTVYIAVTGTIPAVLRLVDLGDSARIVTVLTLCHFFRQTYYLDPAAERGFHLRARVLKVAKAPYLLMAFADVVLGRRFGYVMTPKTRQKSKRNAILAPFGVIAGVLAAAWAIGISQNPSFDSAAHIVTAAVLAGCVALIISERLPAPDPFDANLLARWVSEAPAHPSSQSAVPD
jgi:cellulose synthase (UDP-forming)